MTALQDSRMWTSVCLGETLLGNSETVLIALSSTFVLMKSMSRICRRRLGEYHYYCPFANVDPLYPLGLSPNPARRAV